MQRKALHSLLFASPLVVALACGSSSPKTKDTASTPAVTASDTQPSETPEEKFDRQRVDTVGKMCVRLIDCAFADAKETMSPEELQQMEREKIPERAVDDCSGKYGDMSLSPRQVIGIRSCLSEPTECSAFSDCLVKATSAPEG